MTETGIDKVGLGLATYTKLRNLGSFSLGGSLGTRCGLVVFREASGSAMPGDKR